MLVQERLKDFGQPDLIVAQNTNGIGPVERAAIRRLKELSTNGIEKLMMEHQLDAILAPTAIFLAFPPSMSILASLCQQGTMSKGSPLAYASAGCRGMSRG